MFFVKIFKNIFVNMANYLFYSILYSLKYFQLDLLISHILFIFVKITIMNNETKILQAMLLMVETLNYSSTYKEGFIEEIKRLIQNEAERK